MAFLGTKLVGAPCLTATVPAGVSVRLPARAFCLGPEVRSWEYLFKGAWAGSLEPSRKIRLWGVAGP